MTDSTAISATSGTNNLSKYLTAGSKALADVAAKSITPERLIRIACAAATKNPKLAQCDPRSMLVALMECAATGLEPFTPSQHAYIIPYGKEAQFMAGYRGIVHLLLQSGTVESVHAHVVFEGDDFQVELGVSPTLKHVPKYTQNDRGKPVAVYAVAKFPGGGYQFDVMSYSDIEQTRKMSKSANSPAWANFWGEMAKKVVIKRLCKLLDSSPVVARAIAADNASETGFVDSTTIDLEMESVELPEMEAPVPARTQEVTDVELEAKKQKLKLRMQLIANIDQKTQGDLAERVNRAKTVRELESIESFILPFLKEGAKTA